MSHELPQMHSLKTLIINGASISVFLCDNVRSFVLLSLHVIELDRSSSMILQNVKSPVWNKISIKNYVIDLHRAVLCTEISYLSLQDSTSYMSDGNTWKQISSPNSHDCKFSTWAKSRTQYSLRHSTEAISTCFYPRLRVLNVPLSELLPGSFMVRFIDVHMGCGFSPIEDLFGVYCGIERMKTQPGIKYL